MKKKQNTTCANCGKPSKHLGTCSGTCPRCQNQSVAELEKMCGMKPGEGGRVDSRGNLIEKKGGAR